LSESNRPAVLFVHGAGGGGWEWNVWTRVFAAEGLVVHAPDLKPAAGGLAVTRLQDYSGQVRAFIEGLRSRRTNAPVGAGMTATAGRMEKSVAVMPAPAESATLILVGASLGGLLALKNAEYADALVLINPIPPSPLNTQLPEQSDYPAIIPWRTNASLESTRRALPDADEAAQLYAFRRWRDESGMVMNAARRGVAIQKSDCPTLVIASECDADVPAAASTALAQSLSADLHMVSQASHVGPLLGRNATCVAERVVEWLNGINWKN
jgi:pimeloyl-ACP methyl ester carboxylesterase